ncbi:MAG TPA: hypothetical protein VNI55_14130 [Gaiellaceae bacterium]|nr:hypothetical protein [Gaiellaceae bacterium]
MRAITSAALSDAIPRSSATPGERISCTVTPSDGRRSGPAAAVAATAS